MNLSRQKALSYALSIAISLSVGGLSALVNAGKFDMPGPVQPPLTPPMWVFAAVWALLFLLMGVSAARVYLSGSPEASDALFVYGAFLTVIFLWTVFYFSFQALALSFFWLLFLLALAGLMILRFERACPGTGRLQIPCFLWLVFALYLNLSAWLLNPGAV